MLGQQLDERQMRHAALEVPIRGDQREVEFLRHTDVEGIVEGEVMPARQLDGGLHQRRGWDDEFHLQIVECPERVGKFAGRKRRMMEEYVGDFIHQEVRGHELRLLDEMRGAQRQRPRRIRVPPRTILRQPRHQ